MFNTNKLAFCIAVMALLVLTRLIYLNHSIFTDPVKILALDNLFNHSQYAPVISNRWYIMQDWDLYTYAGIIYTQHGDLSSVNIEHPPLGKYIFGLSVMVFNNAAVIQIFFTLLFLILSYFLAKKITQSDIFASLIVLVLLFEALIIHQLTHALLDLIQINCLLGFLLIVSTKKSSFTEKYPLTRRTIRRCCQHQVSGDSVYPICFFYNVLFPDQ